MRAVTFSQFQRHAQHRAAIKRHPRRAISLPKAATVGERLGAIEQADIVQSEEPAGEQVFAINVLAIDPPGEVQKKFLKDPFEKPKVACPSGSGYFIDSPRCPGVHRRIHITKGKLVGRYLSAWMHIPFAQKEEKLSLGVLRVYMRNRNDMKGQIP